MFGALGTRLHMRKLVPANWLKSCQQFGYFSITKMSEDCLVNLNTWEAGMTALACSQPDWKFVENLFAASRSELNPVALYGQTHKKFA